MSYTVKVLMEFSKSCFFYVENILTNFVELFKTQQILFYYDFYRYVLASIGTEKYKLTVDLDLKEELC